VKLPKVEKPPVELRVWCDRCSIRIAPNEERKVVQGKSYHPTCYTKANPAARIVGS
jgi:hypothetical protein